MSSSGLGQRIAMNWIPILWSMSAGALLAFGLVHLSIAVMWRERKANLSFSLLAVSVTGIAVVELLMMHAQTPAGFLSPLRWSAVPVFTLTFSIVIFVRSYFKVGRPWLGHVAWGVRSLTLFPAFYLENDYHYVTLPAVDHIELANGVRAAVAVGEPSPWLAFDLLAILLMIAFLLDALWTWQRCAARPRHPLGALVIGSLLLAVILAGTTAALINLGVIRSVYFVSPPFLIVALAMGFALSRDVVRAARVASRLRESEARLRLREQRLDRATEAAHVATWEWDLDRDEIWTTELGRTLYGYGPSVPLPAGTFIESLHQDDRARIEAELHRLRRGGGGSFEQEFRVQKADGSASWFIARGRADLRTDGQHSMMRGVSFDITDRKRIEARFRQVVESTPSGLLIIDSAGSIMLANRSAEQIFGRPRGALQSESIYTLLPAHLRVPDGRTLAQFIGAPEAQGAVRLELPGPRRNGIEVDLQIGLDRIENVNESTILVTLVDISERKWAERLVVREREFLRQVIDINPNLIFVKDGDGRFLLVNQAVADLYGMTVETLTGKLEADLRSRAEDVELLRRTDREVLSTMQARVIDEERVTDAAGDEHWLQTIKRPILAEDGSAFLVLGTSIDITARKLNELEIARQRDELAHLSRVKMLGELSGSLAHELNQPLTAILSNAQAAQRFIAQEVPDLGEVREILQDIVSDDKRAGDIIQGLRALLKKGEFRRDSLDLNEVVFEVLKLMHSDLLNAGVEVVTELADALPLVQGDRVQLQQILINLMVNGCEAMSELREADRKLVIATSLSADGGVCVRVSDRGRGVPPGDLDRVFEPFVTSKTEGLGMGLAVCRNIVAAHKGGLWASNNVAGGASFFFTLPSSLRQVA